ncbi:ATP-binding protein [Aliikangiella sp. IMCC44653]
MTTWSLRKRMISISCIVVVIAFSTIYLITKSAYTIASKSRLQESLVAQIYSLMAVIEDENGQLELRELQRNDRLNHLNSGLVAYVLDIDGDLIWRSRSSDSFAVLPSVADNYSLTSITESHLDDSAMFWIGDSIIWEHENGVEGEYLFLIGEKQSLLKASVREFKREVAFWLAVTAIVLIVLIAFALNLSLKPLQSAQSQIELIRRGDAEKINGRFPKELLPLTNSINQLLAGEAQQKVRYRDSLGNLAHSLKTPLAIIKSELPNNDSELTHSLKKQVSRIDDIVKYQLNRSVVTAGQTMRRKTPVKPSIEKIAEALRKVHAQKAIEISTQIEEGCTFLGEKGDLMELVGNLADNACKWAASKVEINCKREANLLIITVSDDGCGVPEAQRALILNRGKRLDQQAEGQGLGLSIVMDIVKIYQGNMLIDQSPLGGALFRLELPSLA